MITKSPRSILRLVCTAGIGAAMLLGGAVSSTSAAASLTPLGFLSDLPGYSMAHGVDPAADGWTDLYAPGISADGNTIVGIGTRNGYAEAFVAVLGTVPEPSSFALLPFAAPALLVRRRSHPHRTARRYW